MEQEPQQATGYDRDPSRAHLRFVQWGRRIATDPCQRECGASPKDAGQNVQHLRDNEHDLHGPGPI